MHGIAFLVLAAASVAYFGRVFDILSLAMAVLAAMSLKDAWTRSRRYHGK